MSENLKVIAKTGHLNEKLQENIVPTKSQKMTLYHNVVLNVRGTDNYSLENPRSSTFPKLYVNEGIVLGDLGL